MKTLVEVKKKLFSKKHTVYIHVDCGCKVMAESIELSILQMLGQIKAYDFEEGECPEAESEEEDGPRKIGFDDYVVGEDDGREPFDDEEEEYEDDE